MTDFIRLEEPAPRLPQGPAFALWQLGFRPFYLLASIFAAVSVGLWGLQVTGILPAPYLPASLWHAHEMIFGFAQAVIVGFLFTAARTWTGRPTPTGRWLAGLAGLWVLARVLAVTPWLWAGAVANVAFSVSAASWLAVPLWQARSRRNYFFVALLLGLGAASLGIHLSQGGLLPRAGPYAVQIGLDLLLFVLCVMGGRVIPMFTNNGVPGAQARRHAGLDQASLGAVLALLVADALALPAPALATIAGLAGLLHLARWLLWRPWRTGRVPLVWVLHLAYAWIPVHLGLRAYAALVWLPGSLPHHALTVGAVGGMVIGMMVRTARGHTARPLLADRWEVGCFILVAMAAVLRVVPPLLAPNGFIASVGASAALWSAGFGLFAVRYWPILRRPRLDGRPG